MRSHVQCMQTYKSDFKCAINIFMDFINKDYLSIQADLGHFLVNTTRLKDGSVSTACRMNPGYTISF